MEALEARRRSTVEERQFQMEHFNGPLLKTYFPHMLSRKSEYFSGYLNKIIGKNEPTTIQCGPKPTQFVEQ